MTPLLNQFSKYPTVGNWNSQISEAVNNGFSHKALLLFRQMKQAGSSPDNLTFPFVAKACAKILDLKLSQSIHAHVFKSPFWSDIFVGTAVINMYVKCNELDFAHKVFEKMPKRDVTLWNAMLLGFAQLGSVDSFLVLFREMRLLGFVPDFVTIIGLTQSVVELKNVNLVKGVHAFGTRVGMLNDVSLVNTLISCYSKCGDLVSAEGMFDGIYSESRTIVSWNSLIAGHALVGNYYKTLPLYRFMSNDGHKPDMSTFLSLLSSCVQPEGLSHGKLIHSHVIQFGCDYDVAVTNTLLTMYSKCGDIDSAWHLFQSMTYKTCISWTAMISSYAVKGCLDKAYSLFLDMERAGEKPDVVTLLSLLSGCSQTGSLELGKWLEDYACFNGLRGNVMIKLKKYFIPPSKTVVSWTTMISGLALNGESKIVELDLKPNRITFLAILQACIHAGFLDKGMECFDLMTRVYNLNPGLEHYSCMVDLLGRKGKFKEALEFIKSMPYDPDAAIWGALINGYKIHQNVEIGEHVAYHLCRLEPQAAVSYVEMANMYASAGKWDGVSKVRALMKCNKVKKCSWAKPYPS
uniref:Pentatricopeptide repeat-containing protein n=1 Tax=Chenopodium quinoa TaxID=63459 RepID=A0A803M2K9_CHEQI